MAINVDISKITGINQVGNSYQRKSAVPLDYYSLFNTKAEAEAYAASNPVSYVGQVISYIDNGEVKVCVIANAAGLLREVGTKPVGDGKTIEVSAEGAVALLGAASAANGTLPMLEEVDGKSKLVWKTLEQIGAGDGNDNTTYAFAFADQKITITPSLNGVAQDAIEVDLSVFVTEDELAAAIEEAIEALPEDKNTTYTLSLSGMELTLTPSEGEAQKITIDAYNKEEVDAKVKDAKDRADAAYALAEKKVDAESYATDKKALQDEDAAIRAIAEGARDTINTFLNSQEVDETVNTLKEIQAEIEKMTDATELAQALASKADKTELQNVDKKFENYTTTENMNTLLAGKQDVIPENTYDAYGAAASAQSAAEAKAAELAGTAKSEAIADADGKLALKADASAVYTKAEADNLLSAKANAADVYAKSETYTQKQVDDLLEGIQAGSSESAASVNTKLEALKKTLNNEIYGNDEGTGDSRIDTAEAKLAGIAEGAQVNVIESVAGVEGNRIAISTVGKAVSIDDSGLRADIADAKAAGTNAGNVASQAVQAAGENANKIQTNTGDITNLKTLTGEHTEKLSAIEAANATHDAEFKALKGTVDGHTTAIAGKAEQSSLDAVSAKAGANEQAIKTLNETTIPGVNAEIAKKANSADVYTKTEIGTIASGKTIVQMIADAQAAATYDDTKIKEDIQKNATAIENITKEGGAIAVAVKAEADRAAEAEQALADDIAEINALLNTVSSEDQITSLKELAIWVEEHGGEASKMAESIKANADAIELINDAEKGILVQAKAHSDANLATAKAYTDAEIAKIHGVDDKTIKLAENKAYVAEVSTDILVQGAQELVLCGGNASGFATV